MLPEAVPDRKIIHLLHKIVLVLSAVLRNFVKTQNLLNPDRYETEPIYAGLGRVVLCRRRRFGAADRRQVRGAQDLQGLHGQRRPSRHPVELGRADDHPRVHPPHAVPEPLPHGTLPRLPLQLRRRRRLFVDEGVLSHALRADEEIHRFGPVAYRRRVVGRQRPQHAFGRVVLPQHPARTGIL